MSFDYTRVRLGERIAAVSGVALIVVMFLPWFELHGGNKTKFLLAAHHQVPPPTGSAWEAFATIYILLLALAVAALAPAALSAAQRKVEFPVAASVAGFGLLMAAVIFYKLFLHRPGGNKLTDAAFGGYLGLAAIIAITIGAYLTAREDRATAGAAVAGASPAAEESPPAPG
jgi:hypothetical protein